MRASVMVLFLTVSFGVTGSECYQSKCRRDRDGTLWCDNHQIKCCHVSAMRCKSSGDKAIPQHPVDSVLNCTVAGGEQKTILVKRAHLIDTPEYDGYPTGGLGGFGADGGPNDRWGLYNEEHNRRDIDF